MLSALTSAGALADASSELQQRPDKVSSFHASFSQKVTDGSGSNVQEGEGELWVKRPNLFNWHMTAPDESVIVSDGKTLWFYNPLLSRSAPRLNSATSNTPFMLIARNQRSDWQQYNVKQQGDTFELTPKTSAGNLKQFMINVSGNGTINQFSAVEQDGQRSSYTLKSQNNGPVSADNLPLRHQRGDGRRSTSVRLS